MARVDVIVPCYNYGDLLEACVASVLSQQEVDACVLSKHRVRVSAWRWVEPVISRVRKLTAQYGASHRTGLDPCASDQNLRRSRP